MNVLFCFLFCLNQNDLSLSYGNQSQTLEAQLALHWINRQPPTEPWSPCAIWHLRVSVHDLCRTFEAFKEERWDVLKNVIGTTQPVQGIACFTFRKSSLFSAKMASTHLSMAPVHCQQTIFRLLTLCSLMTIIKSKTTPTASSSSLPCLPPAGLELLPLSLEPHHGSSMSHTNSVMQVSNCPPQDSHPPWFMRANRELVSPQQLNSYPVSTYWST